MRRFNLKDCAVAVLLAASPSLSALADASISYGSVPMYGQPVAVQLKDAGFPTYIPATRFTRNGSTITIDYEYASEGFTVRPDFGNPPLPLGELAPGNYTVRAQLFDITNPNSAPRVIDTNVPVVPPEEYGLHMVPMEPQAWAATQVTLKSAVYFEPGSMRATMNGNVIRVDFDYFGDAPVGGPMPAGTSSFATLRLPTLQPGSYVVEGWGRPKASATVTRYFTRNFTVAPSVPVVEYYSASLDHYFLTAGPSEIDAVDSGMAGDWKRTGQQFKAWLRASDASPLAKPVCRFFAQGPKSHFYTADEGECRFLQAIEQQQRAEAAAKGAQFLGWAYEGIAFYAVAPNAATGTCPGGMSTIYRAYNKRAAQNDSNHRFTIDAMQRAAMSVSWSDEGAAFCAPN
jgi:hypothetical protein